MTGLRLVAAAAVFLLGLRQGSSAGPTGAQQKVKLIEQRVQAIRGLRPLHRVTVAFPSNQEFNRDLRLATERDNPVREVRTGQAELQLLGLLTSHDDLHAILFQSLGQQVAGFYDPHTQHLFVRASGPQTFGADRYVVAHEYTHALQDQHYHLLRLTPSLVHVLVRNSDAGAAHHALAEGDAVNLQNLFIRQVYTAADIRDLENLQQHLPPSPPVPRAIERQFLFPYIDGVDFVQTLYKNGGMKGIDDAYAHPPQSTYEVMFPAAYLSHWRPYSITLQHVQGFNGWRLADDDVFGAFGYKLLLWQYLPKARAQRVARGYRGDRYVYLTHAHTGVLLLKSVWANPVSARAAYSALRDSLVKRYGHGGTVQGSSLLLFHGRITATVRISGTFVTVTCATSQAGALRASTALTS